MSKYGYLEVFRESLGIRDNESRCIPFTSIADNYITWNQRSIFSVCLPTAAHSFVRQTSVNREINECKHIKSHNLIQYVNII